MYKVPKATEKMPKKSTGREFYYIDATNPTWTYKDVDIQKPKENPLYHTLQQIYSQARLPPTASPPTPSLHFPVNFKFK